MRLAIKAAAGERSCIVHVPAVGDRADPRPLVIMLHGMGGTALNALQDTGWSAKADARALIVAYPEATRPDATKPPSLGRNPPAWNDGSGRFHAAERKVDDVAFLDAWKESLGCPEAPRLDTAAAGVRTRIYGPGSGEAEVAFITVEGLGHQWAGGVSQAPALLVGPSTDKLVATDVIREFFTSHDTSDFEAVPGGRTHE